MSRLDSMIRRLVAHRSVLDWAKQQLQATPGAVLECGLGNGRTYDHLRQNFPDREIFVLERDPSPHPDCWPAPEFLLQGEASDTFLALAESGRKFALINYDLGTGDAEFTRAEAVRLAPSIARLLTPGGLLISVQPMPQLADWTVIPAEETGGGERVRTFRRT